MTVRIATPANTPVSPIKNKMTPPHKVYAEAFFKENYIKDKSIWH